MTDTRTTNARSTGPSNDAQSQVMAALPSIPRNGDEPVFAEPWQAQAFAMTLMLHERKVFSWAEWAEALHRQIELAQRAGDPDLGNTYYQHWLAALEQLLVYKQVCTTEQLSSLYSAWNEAALNTPHGQPITIE